MFIRKVIYRVLDGMLRFWFKFVRENLVEIHNYGSEGLYGEVVKSAINQFMGLTFEDMGKEYLLRNSRDMRFRIGRIGRWWGGDPATRIQEEIDIAVISQKRTGSCSVSVSTHQRRSEWIFWKN